MGIRTSCIGRIMQIGAPQQVTEKFRKRDLLLMCNTGYQGAPEVYKIEAVNNCCDNLQQYQQGQEVEVSIEIKSREYTSKTDGSKQYFTSISAWGIKPYQTSIPTAQPQQIPAYQQYQQPQQYAQAPQPQQYAMNVGTQTQATPPDDNLPF